MASERNELPGGPGNGLIREVRRVLYQYVRCKPQRGGRLWRMAWDWARAIRERDEDLHRLIRYKPRKRPWPMPCEIASQYLFLCLMEMRSSTALRLPFRAAQCVTPAVAEHLQHNGNIGSGVVSIPLIESQPAGVSSAEPPFVTG